MNLHKNTVSNLLLVSLDKLMDLEELESFRLVGGTSLSLQLGHRESIDIDLFTDAEYQTIDFEEIDKIISETFPYVDSIQTGEAIIGKSYFVGENRDELVKLDLYYTETFAFPLIQFDKLRMASIEEIGAMKLEVIGQGGRKKDFWDIHELLEQFSLQELLDFYSKRYPYSHTSEELRMKLVDFSQAEEDLLPICLKEKEWELIKLDIELMAKI